MKFIKESCLEKITYKNTINGKLLSTYYPTLILKINKIWRCSKIYYITDYFNFRYRNIFK